MSMTKHAETGLLWSSPNIKTHKCTVVIQDKPKTRFGKWIHDVLTYYINFEHKKLRTAAFKNNNINNSKCIYAISEQL